MLQSCLDTVPVVAVVHVWAHAMHVPAVLNCPRGHGWHAVPTWPCPGGQEMVVFVVVVLTGAVVVVLFAPRRLPAQIKGK